MISVKLNPRVLRKKFLGEWDNKIVFSTTGSELGEAPFWHEERSSLFWVDILNNTLVEKCLSSVVEIHWELPDTVSSVSGDSFDPNILWLISDGGLVRFDIASGLYTQVVNLPIDRKQGFRTNDGSVGPDGRYWFGTMLRTPELGKGVVFSLGSQGDIRLEMEDCSIPNTFVWMHDGSVLISDSLRGICDRVVPEPESLKVCSAPFYTSLSSKETPDGGALDIYGNVWLALWGGFKVVCINSFGEKIYEISMPVPQPSSCCFGGPDNNTLFVTSAREGLSASEVEKYPLSGFVFKFDLPVKGQAVNGFRWGN